MSLWHSTINWHCVVVDVFVVGGVIISSADWFLRSGYLSGCFPVAQGNVRLVLVIKAFGIQS